MIERLLRRTAGEVRVRVTGASLPRFLNACTQGGVRLRRMERVSWDRMDATLSLGVTSISFGGTTLVRSFQVIANP